MRFGEHAQWKVGVGMVTALVMVLAVTLYPSRMFAGRLCHCPIGCSVVTNMYNLMVATNGETDCIITGVCGACTCDGCWPRYAVCGPVPCSNLWANGGGQYYGCSNEAVLEVIISGGLVYSNFCAGGTGHACGVAGCNSCGGTIADWANVSSVDVQFSFVVGVGGVQTYYFANTNGVCSGQLECNVFCNQVLLTNSCNSAACWVQVTCGGGTLSIEVNEDYLFKGSWTGPVSAGNATFVNNWGLEYSPYWWSGSPGLVGSATVNWVTP
jgi:hypothetical protein